MPSSASSFVETAQGAGPDTIPTCPVPALLDKTVARTPDAWALDFMGRRHTYRQLGDLITRAAQGLQTLGVTAGDRVGLCLPNTPYFPIFYFAALKLGAVIVNYNPLYVERELEFQIKDSGTSVMITVDLAMIQGKLAKVAAGAGLRKIVVCPFAAALPPGKSLLFSLFKRGDVGRWRGDALHVGYFELISDRTAPTLPKVDPGDVAVIQYTGGTTGQPKGATLTHANLTANCAQVIHHVGEIETGQRIIGVLPLFHVFALTYVLNYGVAIGAELVLLPRFELATTLKTIRSRKVTNFPAVPTIYSAINNTPAKLRGDLSSLQYCISGGAPLPVEVKAKFEQLTGCTVVEGYGLSETSPVVSTNPLHGPGKAGSVGVLMVGTTVEIRDTEDPQRVLAPGEKGELCIRGPQVMCGYWNRPKETEEVFVDGALRTGDVGYMDADGFLFLVDRKKDLILAGGYNVYPRVIEEAIYQHPAIRDVTVIGVPDKYRGEAPKAFVTLKDGQTATPEEIKTFLAEHLNKIEMPREIEIRDELPRTMIGKLSKKELVAEEAAKRSAAAA
ncbi:long-chain fatty acid--CoA ligase [Caulobacter sp. S45]|uniref:long-chain-fatty-acid--CoA ligase n=1 Tax=Caulobacter sp. S45 TaxID=1641861 RepID=UPI0015769A77|nr:long-chain fatty acid--CoA ligase [Caulobacter sp. S45]